MPSDIEPSGGAGEIADLLTWDEQGLVPVVVQQHDSGEILMFAWADRIALERSLRQRRATFFSRSRGRIWVKGEESGNFLELHEVRTDCDGDVLLYRVAATGPACHRGWRSCFAHRVAADGAVLREP